MPASAFDVLFAASQADAATERSLCESVARAVIVLQVAPGAIFMLSIEGRNGAQVARPFVNGPAGHLETTPCGPQPVGSLDEALAFAFDADRRGRSVFIASASFDHGWYGKEEIDAQGHKTGRVYPLGDRRTANVHRVGVLAVDADVKAGGHPGAVYTSHAEARADLERVCRETGLPLPSLVVDSGSGGVHGRWFLTEALPLASWRALAEGLARLLVASRYHCDSACTTDSVRLLRLPGVRRHKAGTAHPVRVTAAFPPARHSPEALRAVLDRHGTLQAAPVYGTGSGPARQEAPMAPAQWRIVSTNCLQVRHSLETGGAADTYPIWTNVLLVVAHCTNAESAAVAVSNQHPDFTRIETLSHLMQLKLSTSAPPRCSTLDHVRPGLCDGCLFRDDVASPVLIDPDRRRTLPYASELAFDAAREAALAVLRAAPSTGRAHARARNEAARAFFSVLFAAPPDDVRLLVPQIVYFVHRVTGLGRDLLAAFVKRITGDSQDACLARVDQLLAGIARKDARSKAILAAAASASASASPSSASPSSASPSGSSPSGPSRSRHRGRL